MISLSALFSSTNPAGSGFEKIKNTHKKPGAYPPMVITLEYQ
jgi:hypothetical protein